jgi:DNA repair protein RadC
MKTIHEIGLTLKKSKFMAVVVKSSTDSSNVIRNFYGDDIELYESMFMLLLNRANRTTGFVKIAQGGTAGCIIDVKIIAKYAIDSLCHGIIIAHNHPSGSLIPSAADENITSKIKNALNLFDIKLLDHLIITNDDFYSFADNGYL